MQACEHRSIKQQEAAGHFWFVSLLLKTVPVLAKHVRLHQHFTYSPFSSSIFVLVPGTAVHIPPDTIAPFTQRSCIIAAGVVRQFSTFGYSHSAKHLHLKDEPLFNSHRKPALQLLKRRDGTRQDEDIGVFSRCFPGVPPVNLILSGGHWSSSFLMLPEAVFRSEMWQGVGRTDSSPCISAVFFFLI